jgi:hypothetical protein
MREFLHIPGFFTSPANITLRNAPSAEEQAADGSPEVTGG